MENKDKVLQEESWFEKIKEKIDPKHRKLISKLLIHAILIVIGLCMLIPFLWMLSASFKEELEIFKFPIEWIPSNPTLKNYASIFFNEKYNFGRFYWNSLEIAILITLAQIVTCSMAAYAFAKLEFPGRDKIFLGYLGTLMVPFHVTMIPLFILIKAMKLVDTPWALILPGAFDAYGVFLLRQFYLGIPNELSEAAKIDGCGHFRIYAQIILPNVKPAIATLSIFTFLWSWNNFLKPLIFINSPEKMTITLGLKTFVSEYNVEFGKIMAGTTLAVLPVIIVFFIAQRYFIEGLALSGIKG